MTMPENDRGGDLAQAERDFAEEWLPWDCDLQSSDEWPEEEDD